MSKISPTDLPPILTTTISDEGWSAEQIDAIGRGYLKSMPNPKLPESGGSMGGGGNSVTIGNGSSGGSK